MDNIVVDYPKLEKNAHLYNIRGLNYGKSKVFHSPYVDVAQLKDVSSVGELSSNECRNDKEDGKSSQEQFVEEVNIGKQEDYVSSSNWKSEDIHSLAVNEVKLEDDSIKEESFFSECINDEESKSFQEQLIEGEKIWKREDFISHENWKSESVHSMSVDEMKLEDNSSIEELSFNERSIDEVWMKEDFISSKNCVLCCDKKQMNEIEFPECGYDGTNKERNVNDCKSCECSAKNGSSDNCGIENYKNGMCGNNSGLDNIETRQKRRFEARMDEFESYNYSASHKCEMCEYTTTRKDHITRHIEAVHLKLKNYKCHMCGYAASKNHLLAMHIKVVHLKLKNHKCNMCNYSTSVKSNLTTHIKRVHSKSEEKLKNHHCRMCDYSTSIKSNLTAHIKRVHSKTDEKLKNHNCHMCEYTTDRKSNLKSHVERVHFKLKNHKCHLCDYETTQKSILKVHINSVHLKLKNHKCHMCEYTTTLKCSLKVHINSVHLKLKNHKCHMCEYTAFQKGNLKFHIDSAHLKLKNLKCHSCEYSTSIKYNLAAHIKRVHSKVKNH